MQPELLPVSYTHLDVYKRQPLESIKESVQLSNRFLLYIGAAALIICAILVWFFSKRLTAPVRELATLSEKMANQDFEAKYTGGGPSEIAELGENFNQMSWKLERSISDLKSANNNLQKDIEMCIRDSTGGVITCHGGPGAFGVVGICREG